MANTLAPGPTVAPAPSRPIAPPGYPNQYGYGYAPQGEMMAYAPDDLSQRVSLFQAQAARARADSYAKDGNHIGGLLAGVVIGGFAAYKLSRTA